MDGERSGPGRSESRRMGGTCDRNDSGGGGGGSSPALAGSAGRCCTHHAPTHTNTRTAAAFFAASKHLQLSSLALATTLATMTTDRRKVTDGVHHARLCNGLRSAERLNRGHLARTAATCDAVVASGVVGRMGVVVVVPHLFLFN